MSRVPHILHVFSTFTSGGPQVRTCSILNALGKAFTHTIMATDGNYDAATRIAPEVSCRFVPPPKGKGNLLYAFALGQAFRQMRPDAAFTYNWGSFDAILAIRMMGLCPLVHTEDGFGKDEAAGLKKRRIWARRAVLNAAHAVVVPSNTLRNISVGAYGLKSNKVRFIPNGVDLSRFYSGIRNLEWRRRFGIPEESLLVGYIGRLSAEKNLPLLLEAFAGASAANTRLAIIGDGPCRSELEQLSTKLNLTGRVIFTGPIEDPSGSYRALDVFAMSSQTEQMPMALLEAMASGLPAICTDVGDTAEMLGAECPVLVPAGDLTRYREALGILLASGGLRSQLGQHNRKRCEEQYSFDRMLHRYASLFGEATDAAARAY